MGIRMRRKKLGMFQIRFKAIDRALLAGMLLLIVATMVAFHGYTENAEQSQINFVQLVMERNAINQAEQFETFVDEMNDFKAALQAEDTEKMKQKFITSTTRRKYFDK